MTGSWTLGLDTGHAASRYQSVPVIPPRVDYSLTGRGRELTALLIPLMEWIAANAADILAPA